ncbi:DsbA family protein [Curtobacterium flaccumfaciens]|jgi:protein-disulfide isomerase|uniref:DsbA family protein n=1 Tax=Curtobacterium flaccumfaciens TaxID=2035 RepID=UPI00399FC163
MTRSTRIGVVSGLIAGALVLIVIAVFVIRANVPSAPTAATAASSSPTGAATPTRVLGAPGKGTVTVVEFLDFECEACAAFYPYVEDLRQKYEGEVTFGFRYFPLPGHGNSRTAAAAVEAAAQQNEVEGMYQRMYETQKDWGERGSDSQAERFRSYAEDLGLDMGRYDRDVTSKTVLERIQRDVDLGTTLGVNSTPTFFIDGDVVPLQTYADLQAAVDTAVQESR